MSSTQSAETVGNKIIIEIYDFFFIKVSNMNIYMLVLKCKYICSFTCNSGNNDDYASAYQIRYFYPAQADHLNLAF